MTSSSHANGYLTNFEKMLILCDDPYDIKELQEQYKLN